MAAALLLVSCSSNPEKEKAEFLASGEKYAKAGKYHEAVIQFRNVIQIDPRSANAHYQLALAYLKLKSVQQAYQELVSAVELDPKNTDAQLRLAELFLGGHKYNEAQKTLEMVIATDPGNAWAHTLLGEKHAAVQDWPLAIREFETAMARDQAQIENYANLAFVYSSTGRAAEAEAVLRKAAVAQPKSLETMIMLARFYYAQHRLPEAEAAIRAASEANPEAKAPRLLLAKIYIDAGRTAEAEQVCKELKYRVTDDPDGYGALAWLYETTGQKEKALAELQALAAGRPTDAAIKGHLTDALIELNRIQEAARINQEVLAARPYDARALASKGRLLIAQEKFGEAKTALEQAMASDSQSATVHYLLGVAESSLGDADSARRRFARALELSPKMADAAIALADLDANNGDWDDALRLSNQGLQTKPDSALAYTVEAKVSMAKGNRVKAEAQLRSALDRDPVFLPAIAALLDLQVGQGRGKEATERISALATQHLGDTKLRMLLALAYVKQGDLTKAEAIVKEVLGIDRNMQDAYAMLGQIRRARGAWDEAIAWYKRAIEANPKKVENYMALSGLYEKQDAWEDAKRVAEQAHSLDPTSPFIANNLAYLYLEHAGDAHTALLLAQQAKKKLPDSPIVSDTIGWAYYKLGLAEAAVGQLSESVRRAPGNATYEYHLGMAYLAAGHPGNAARFLRQTLASNPDSPYAASAKTALHSIPKFAP
jgi:tetratricopeptide (TPR) repeat protein